MQRLYKKHEKGYTHIGNDCLKDTSISLRAKGLLCMMFSLPDGWEYSINGLAVIANETPRVIKNAIDELKEAGYLSVTKLYPDQTSSGKIEYVYEIFEKPQAPEKQDVEIQGVEKQPLEKQALEIQALEIQGIENSTQYNKDIYTKDISNKDIYTKDNTSRKKTKKETVKDVLQSINNQQLADTLEAFADMRKANKKPLTGYSLRLILNKLAKMSTDVEIQCNIIRQSIENSWLSVYPLKTQNQNYVTQQPLTSNPFIVAGREEGLF